MADDDRITALPESVLVYILSFLPIHDAIKTEALSKRWQFLWTYLPSIQFRQANYLTNNEGLVGFVDNTLAAFNCSKLEKFGVDFDYEPHFAPNVNSWIQFAAGKGVEELFLEFDSVAGDLYEDVRYELPQVLYTNSSFKRLRFSLCRVIPKGDVVWNSLKELSVGYVKLSDGVIEKILAGSPVLEVLELYNYGGFSRLGLSNTSVKKLILREFWEGDDEDDDSEEDDEDDEHDDSEEEESDGEDHDSEEEEDDGEHDYSEEEESDGEHNDSEEEEDDGEHDDPDEEESDGEHDDPEEEEDDGEHDDAEEDGVDGEQDDPEQDEVDGEYDNERLEISAPYLQSLEISGCLPRNCQLRNISSLVDATLDCDLDSDDDNERIQDTLRGLLESLVHVKRLTLGAQAAKVGV